MRSPMQTFLSHSPSALRTHLAEIKLRALYCIFSLLLCFLCAYSHSTQILFFIVKPMCYTPPLPVGGAPTRGGLGADTNSLAFSEGSFSVPTPEGLPQQATHLQFIYTNVTEAFYATLQSSMVVALLCILPLLCYQSLCFLMPSLYVRESFTYKCALLYTLIYLGVVTACITTKVLPIFYRFLLLFSVADSLLQIRLEARIAPYLSWIFTTTLYTLGFSLLPLLLYLCLQRGWLSLQFLVKNRKITTYFLLVAGALMSPADLMSQLICTCLLFIFLECVIWRALYDKEKHCTYLQQVRGHPNK